MKIFSKMFPRRSQPIQKKSDNVLRELMDYSLFGSDYDYNFNIDIEELRAYKALGLYRIISPVFTGVNLIAEEFANLKPRVYDEKAKKFVEHDILDLLGHPFGDTSWREFATEFASQFLITGNSYLSATGNIKQPPLEIVNIYPAAVNALPSVMDGYNGQYIVSLPVGSTNYVRNETLVPGYFRFVNSQSQTDTSNKELWHIRNFNPRNRPGLAFYGMSPLTGIFYEIEQYQSASKHNRSLLKNGAKLSTVFVVNNVLDQSAYERLTSQLRSFVGAENTGKSMVFEDGLDVKELGQSNRDMDFLQLKKEVAMAIFNSMRIPIPLVVAERTTLNNMQEARLQLYDNAVLPLANRLFEEVTTFLMPRYKGSENLIITYNQDEITALEPRKLDQVTKKQQMGIFTINELRALMGYDPVEGGDKLFHATSEVPISESDDEMEARRLASADNSEEADLNDEEDKKQKQLASNISRLRFPTGEKVFKTPYRY